MISRKCVSVSVAAMFVCAMCVFVADTRAANNASASGSLSKQDQDFVNKAWNINTAEVQLGQTAQQKATNADVKTFGQRMVTDHTRLNNELSDLVKQHMATLPTKVDAKHQQLIDRLSKLSGSDFDKEYMNAMVKGHEGAVAAFEKESRDTAQTPVDKWAGQTVPTLKEHLQMAVKTGKEVGAPAASDSQAITAGEKEPAEQQK